MFQPQIHSIDDDSISWVPFVPCVDDALSRYLHAGPIGDLAPSIDWKRAEPRDIAIFNRAAATVPA